MLAAGARVIHVDVMDGHFVPPITVGPLVVAALADAVHDAGAMLDVHLMIERPERHVAEFVKAGADSITFHAEATPHVAYAAEPDPRSRRRRRRRDQPRHAVGALAEVDEAIDLALCMTVNPGWGGQPFIEHSLEKLPRMRALVGARRRGRGRRRHRPAHRARLPAGGRERVRRRLGDLRRARPGRGLRGDRRVARRALSAEPRPAAGARAAAVERREQRREQRRRAGVADLGAQQLFGDRAARASSDERDRRAAASRPPPRARGRARAPPG